MSSFFIVTLGLFTAACYPAWIFIHEFSHIYAAKWLVGVRWWRIKPYPHFYKGQLRFASFTASYDYDKNPGVLDEACVHLAPRLANYIAALLYVFAFVVPTPYRVFWMVFWGAGLVDLFVGSLGISEFSDLRQAAKKIRLNPWYLRSMAVPPLAAAVGITVLALAGTSPF